MEAAAQPHSMEVEVAAVKQEVLHGFLHVPAPGEVRVGDQTQAVEVRVESRVAEAEASEGHVQDAGRFPHPWLWAGVGAELTHGGCAEGVM